MIRWERNWEFFWEHAWVVDNLFLQVILFRVGCVPSAQQLWVIWFLFFLQNIPYIQYTHVDVTTKLTHSGNHPIKE